jgi:hypothetical protein
VTKNIAQTALFGAPNRASVTNTHGSRLTQHQGAVSKPCMHTLEGSKPCMHTLKRLLGGEVTPIESAFITLARFGGPKPPSRSLFLSERYSGRGRLPVLEAILDRFPGAEIASLCRYDVPSSSQLEPLAPAGRTLGICAQCHDQDGKAVRWLDRRRSVIVWLHAECRRHYWLAREMP